MWQKMLQVGSGSGGGNSIEVLEGNFQPNQVLSYPSGFNKDNTMVLAIMGYDSSLGAWTNCVYRSGVDACVENLQLRLLDSNIVVWARMPGTIYTNFKIYLLKV